MSRVMALIVDRHHRKDNMKTIIKYHVEILKNSDKREFEVETFHIGLENKRYVVLTDIHFTKLNKQKRDRNELEPTIDDPMVYAREWGISSLDGIVYTLYTYKKVRPETIRRQISAYINKKYGYLFNVSLDFIK